MEEKKTAITTNHQSIGLSTVSEQQKAIARQIKHVNRWIPFPLTAPEIVDWAADIERLAPERTPEEISFLMDAFKIGDLEWDKEKGIVNIFKGLRRVTRDEETGKLILLKPIW